MGYDEGKRKWSHEWVEYIDIGKVDIYPIVKRRIN